MAGSVIGFDGIPIFIGGANERLCAEYHQGHQGNVAPGVRMVQPMHGPVFSERGHSPSGLPPVETPQPYDIRASLDYGANGGSVQSSWGVESRTPPMSPPPSEMPNNSVQAVRPIERSDISYLSVLMKGDTNSLPMRGVDPPEGVGQYAQRIGPLLQRVDLTHGEPHLNQDIIGLKPKETRKLFGDKKSFDDFHRRDL